MVQVLVCWRESKKSKSVSKCFQVFGNSKKHSWSKSVIGTEGERDRARDVPCIRE